MKKVLMLSLVIMLVAGAANAQERIGIFSDPAGNGNCFITMPTFAQTSLYVVHFTTGATGSEFMVIGQASNAAWSYLGSAVPAPFLSIGNVDTGLALAYTACLLGPAIHVVTLNFFGFSSTAVTCARLEVVPSPNAGGIIKAVNCGFQEIPAVGGHAFVNPTAECTDPNCFPTATEESTWGRVKSLYR